MGLVSQSSPTELIAKVNTDHEGAFLFQNIEEGSYNISIQYAGYQMDSTSIAIEVSGNEAIELEAVVHMETDLIEVNNLTVTNINGMNHLIQVYPNPVSDYPLCTASAWCFGSSQNTID